MRLLYFVLTAGYVASFGATARAASDAWASTPPSTTWTGINWTTGTTTPGAANGTITSGDSLFFGTSTTTSLKNDEVALFSIGGITFNSGASAYTIGGNSLTLTGGITNSSTATQTINDALSISGGQTINTNTGNIILGGTVTANNYIIKTGTGTLSFAGVNNSASQIQFQGAGGVVDVGAGGITFSGSGTNALGSVLGGTVNGTGGGVVTIADNGFVYAQTAGQTLTVNAVIAGGRMNTNNNNGNIVLTAANTNTGVILSSGTVTLANSLAEAKGDVYFNSQGSNVGKLAFDSSVASNTFIIGGLVSGNVAGTLALVNNAATPVAITLDAGNDNNSQNFSGVMSGAGSFNKWGSGTETFWGANTYTGSTGVAMGTLKLDFSQSGAPTTNILYNGVTAGGLVLGGQSGASGSIRSGQTNPGNTPPDLFQTTPTDLLVVTGKASTTNSQTFGGTTLKYGYSGIQAIAGTSGSATINLGAITQQAGGEVLFLTPSAGGAVTTTGAIKTTTSNDSSGILGGYAIVTNQTSPTVTSGTVNYATVDGSGNIVAYGGYLASGATINDSGAGTPTNIQLTTTSVALGSTTTSGGVATAVASGGAVNINTLYNTQSSGSTLTIGAGNVLRLGVHGGILLNGSAGLTIASSGTLTAGGNTINTAGEISIFEPYQSQQLQISSVIANNNTASGAANSTGAGAVTLSFAGNPMGGNTVLRLNGNNTYSGGTYINDGRIEAYSTTAFGTGTVYVLPGGEVILQASGNTSNNFVISGNGAGEGFGALRGGNGSAVYTGTISLAGDASMSGVNANMNVNGQITGTGTLTWQNGNTLTLGNTSTTLATMNNWNGGFYIQAGTVKESAANQLAHITGNVLINNGAILELNGKNDTVNGLTSSGVGQGTVQNSTTATSSVLSVGNNGGSYTFAGAIRDGAGSGSGSGTLKLDKVGAGVFIVGNTTASGTSANDYTGGTQVDGGTLMLAASAPTNILGSTSGALTVNTGGTLDLNGNSLTVGALGGSGGVITSSLGSTAVTLTAGNAGTSTFAGVLQDGNATSLGLTKVGTGILDLTGASTYTGATSISAGTLELGNGGTINMANVSFTSTGAALALGDASGVTNLTLTSQITGSSGNSIVGGASTNSTVTLGGAGPQTYANAFGGAGTNQNNLNVVVAGTSTPISTLSGVSTYTGSTTINSGATLNLTGALGNTAVTVTNGGVLTGNGSGTAGSSRIGGTLNVVGGGQVKLVTPSGTTPQIAVTGNITIGNVSGTYVGNFGTLTYTLGTSNAAEALTTAGTLTANNVYIDISNDTQLSTGTGYTLLNYGSLASGAVFSLSNTAPGVLSLNVGRDTETLTVGVTSVTLTLTGAVTPGVAYFDGKVSTAWNDVSNPTFVNWSTNLAGTNDAGNIAGSTSDVILNSSNATTNLSSSTLTETLGANTVINSLNVNGNGTTTIAADGSTLTINAAGDSNADTGGGYTGNTAGTGIKIASGAAAFTVNAPIVLGGTGSQTWTNASANGFTVGGSVTGKALATGTLSLANSSTGSTTINGVIGDGSGGSLAVVVNNTGSGTTTLTNTNTYSGGTTLNGGSLTATAALSLGSGNVTVNPTNTTSTAADNATLNTNGSIASTAAVTVNSETGDGGFGIGKINFNSTTPTIGSLAGNGKVVLNNAAGTTLTVGSTNNLSSTFSGAISDGAGTGSLIKAGTGTLVLSGADTYSGSTTINAGVLVLSGSNTYGGTTTINNTATLRLGSSSSLPSNTLAGGSHFAINTGGVFDLNNFNATLGSLATGAGTITNGSATSGTSTLTLASGGTLGQTLTDSGAGHGLLYLALTSGSLTLNNADSYSGGTSVALGATINDNNATGLGSGTVTDNGTVVIGVSGATIANAFSGNGVINASNLGGGSQTTVFSGNLSGFTGTLNIGPGGGKVALTNNTNGQQISSSATIDILNGGTLYEGNGLTYGASLILNGGNTGEGLGQLRLEGGTTWSGAVTLAGNSTIGGNGFAGGGTLSGVISGAGFGFTKVSSNTITLANANTYSGTTTVSGGSLDLANTNALQNSTLNTNGIIFDFSVATHAFTFGGLTGSGNITLADNAGTPNAVTLSIGNNNSSLTYSGVLSGAGSLGVVGTGTETLTGVNTYTGSTTVGAGSTLQAGNGTGSINNTTSASVGASGSLVFNETSGTTFGAAINNNGTVIGNENSGNTNTLAGDISGNGAFTQNGLGTTVFGTANDYTGATTINAGTLQLAADSAISSGSAVTLAGGTLGMGSHNATVASVLLINGSITGSTGTLTSLTDYELQNGSVSAILGGSVGANIDAGGLVTLSGANTFTGPTYLSNNSTVNYQNGTAFGTNSAIAEVDNGDTIQVQGGIAGGSQAMTLVGVGSSIGTGALENVSGNNSYAGQVTMLTDTTISSDSGTLTLSGGIDNGGNDLTIQGPGGFVSSGAITNSGGLFITGSSSTTLTAANTYGGNTGVNSGTLVLASTASISNSSALTVSGGATLVGAAGSSSSTRTFALTGNGNGQANLLVGHTAGGINTTGVMNLSATDGGTFDGAKLEFNLSTTNNADSTQLNIGATDIAFNTLSGMSTTLSLNLVGNTWVGGNTAYVLIAGTVATGGSGQLGSQYTGLDLADTSTSFNGGTMTRILNSNLGGTGSLNLSFINGNTVYGANSYLFLYQNTTTGQDDIEVEVVPEPGTWALMLAGLGLLFIWQRRKSKQS